MLKLDLLGQKAQISQCAVNHDTTHLHSGLHLASHFYALPIVKTGQQPLSGGDGEQELKNERKEDKSRKLAAEYWRQDRHACETKLSAD